MRYKIHEKAYIKKYIVVFELYVGGIAHQNLLRNANLITCNSELTWNGALRCRSKRSHARKGFTHPTFALYLIHIPKSFPKEIY
jgi:hypothetical protein